jgi:mono/diheme cytochrome c family protein
MDIWDMIRKYRKTTFILCSLIICLIWSCRFYFPPGKETFVAKKSNHSLENGKNIAFNVCAGCHYDESVKKFSGMQLNDLPKIAGKLYSANLTKSITDGVLTHYSNDELAYLIRTGIANTGKFMPYMMRPTISDEDLNDLILFFRSDDPSLNASNSTVGKTQINLVGKLGIRLAAKPQPYHSNVPKPDESDQFGYGRYLVGIIGCYHCHSKKAFGLNYSEPEKSKGYMQGGMKLKDYDGKRIYGSNLTPDMQTGIGNWSLREFSKAVIHGQSLTGRELYPPMPRFTAMTDKQVAAIYFYLQHITPVKHSVRRRS